VIASLLPYRWMAVALLAAAAVGWIGIQNARIDGLRADLARAKAQHAQAVAEAASAAAAQSERYRLEEQRRDAAQKEAIDAAEIKASVARADAINASAAAGRLQQRIAALVAQASRAAANPGVAASGTAASDLAGMLADVLGRCTARVRLLADIADRRGAAGELCVKAYDALTPPTAAPP